MKNKSLIILAALAAVCFNNWLLGLVLNPQLLFHGGSVSELSALDQPHQLVFRSLDVISGILFVLVGAAAYRVMSHGRGYYWLSIGAAVLGAANAADAFQPLACSQTINQHCSIAVDVSLSHVSIPSHGYSSVIIAICYLLLPIGGLLYANRTKAGALKAISLVLILLAILYLVATVVSYLIRNSISGGAWGPTQEAQMLLMGAWFVIWAHTILTTDRAVTRGR